MKPATVAVMKCRGHDKSGSQVARGTEEADREAKQTAGYQPQIRMMQADTMIQDLLPKFDVNILIEEQGKASPYDISVREERRATNQGKLLEGTRWEISFTTRTGEVSVD